VSHWILRSIEVHGSRMGPSTGWRTYPGFVQAIMECGKQIYMGSDLRELGGIEGVVEKLEERGVNVAPYRERCALLAYIRGYPPKPTYATLFSRNYSWEPAEVKEWVMSTTFNCWRALVQFADGYVCVTSPKIKPDDPYYAWLEARKKYANLLC